MGVDEICLIETWDVLKSNHRFDSRCPGEFNRNMGCIEISILLPPSKHHRLFNRNMGCIEIL